MTLKSRVAKVEQRLGNPGKAPFETACIYSGDPDAEGKRRAAIEKYREKYGCLGNLRIVTTHCPEPLPLPERFKKNNKTIACRL